MAEVLPHHIHRLCGAVQGAQQDLLHHIGGHVQELKNKAAKVVEPLSKLSGNLNNNVISPLNLQVHGALAKLTPPSAAGLQAAVYNRRAAQKGPAIGDVGMSKVDIAKKLSSVPLYTVTNSQHELVVVSSEKPEDQAKMVIFFFNKDDAKALIDRIKSENQKLAKDARVRTMTADLVYDYLTKRPTETSDVGFRLMPDKRQVKAALRLYSDAGQSITSLRGVPVFQAEDLSVKIEEEKYTPVFFSKDDLDVALKDAHLTRRNTQAAEYSAEAAKHKAEFKAATKEYALASDDKGRQSARSKAEVAQDREAHALDMVKQINRAPMPQVEVACFEDVLTSMDRDITGKWSQLMFVPPGVMSTSKQ